MAILYPWVILFRMYQLAKQAPATSDLTTALFARYVEQVFKPGSISRAPTQVSFEPEEESDSVELQHLKEVIRKYPDGLAIPYMP